MNMQTSIIFIMEIIGTIAFAASGAMVGIRRQMDIFGVCVLGVVTAVGGGMIRDIVLGVIPPSVFQHSVYVAVATAASCGVFALVYFKEEYLEGHHRVLYDRILLIMDTIGLGIFTVVGVNTGIRYGHTNQTFLLTFLGTITGVGGGVLRDMMAGVPPAIFVRHVYACASIVGALTCVYIYRWFGEAPSMILSSAVIMLIRYLAAHYRWNLPVPGAHKSSARSDERR